MPFSYLNDINISLYIISCLKTLVLKFLIISIHLTDKYNNDDYK